MPKTPTPYVHTVAEVPEGEHYVALMDESLSYDDGYGERGSPSRSTHNYLTYIVLGNREQALGWLQEQERLALQPYGSRKQFKIVLVKPATVQRTVNISLE